MKTINIVVCSVKKEGTLFKLLYSILENNGGVCGVWENNIKKSCNNPKYNLLCFSSVPSITGDDGIIVFDTYFKNNENHNKISSFIPIFESENKKAISYLKGINVTPVSCGTKQKDTLSVASVNETSALISLQRDLKDVFGKTKEPHDFTVRLLDRHKLYYTLAVGAVMLLLDI